MIAEPERPNRRARRAAIANARAQGCRCNPEVRQIGRYLSGEPHVGVFHDSWCPLMRTDSRGVRTYVVAYLPDDDGKSEGDAA